MTGRIPALKVTGLLLLFGVAALAAPHDEQPASLQQFKTSIHQYVQLHRQIEEQLPPLGPQSDAQDIIESSNAMATALQIARAGAHEGDLFTQEVGVLLRARVTDALIARGFLPEEMVAATLDEVDEDAPRPIVNGRFPWRRGAAMWSSVLAVLPPLPQELQYRFVGRDLVLVDTHADLVVDILRNAVR